MMGSENMYMTNPYSKVDTFMRFEEYQRRYPYTGKTEEDRLVWLMGCIPEKPYYHHTTCVVYDGNSIREYSL